MESKNDIAAVLSADVRGALDELVDAAGIGINRTLVHRILATGVLLGQERTDRLDLKIVAAAIEEMREAFELFRPFAGIPKVTVFGSARTKHEDPLYRQARSIAADLAGHGWMVVTGAGPGIMQAASEGAGPDRAIGVSIRLPFEEKPNAVVLQDSRVVEMKYFFTRKLMLVKESKGFVCLPGGFGTMDEVFELLTLQQTGKAVPVPIVLLDRAGGEFWQGLREFVEGHLVPSEVISREDFNRVLITDLVTAACEEVTGFWRNYHSLRWVGERLVLRLHRAPTAAEVQTLNARFVGNLADGPIVATAPLEAERVDSDHLDLPRLVLTVRQQAIGSLHLLVRALNDLPSAPGGLVGKH